MRANKTFFALNAAVFLMMLGVGLNAALLPKRIMDLTGSSSAVGYLASAFAIAYILFQLPMGSLSDKLGFKAFILAGYGFCVLTGILYYISNSAILIFLGRILQGAGEAPIWALAPALISIKFPEHKGAAMGIYNAVLHVGLTLGPLLGLFVFRFFTGNQVFLFYILCCVAGFVMILFGVERVEKNTMITLDSAHFRKILGLLSSRVTLTALFGSTLYGAGYGIFITLVPAYLFSEKGFSQSAVSVFFSLFFLAISLSQLISGHLSDRRGREGFMMGGLVLASLCFGVFPLLAQPLVTAVLATAGLGLGVFYLSSMAFLNEIVPVHLKGTISGAYYLFWGLGYFAGPILLGQLAEAITFAGSFYGFSGALMLEAILMLAAFKAVGKDV